MKSLIEKRLRDAFNPVSLVITDDSERHIGHAGSVNGAKHFAIEIASLHFLGQTRVQSHRDIYAVLSDLIPQPIHALQIKILTPS